MMTLRRSARLSTVTSASKTALLLQNPGPGAGSGKKAPSRAQHNGISKPRKTPTGRKKSPTKQTPSTGTPKSTDTPAEFDRNQADSRDVPPNPFLTDRIASRLTTPPPLDRPVEPHRTNVPLLTPHGSSVVAYPADMADLSPSKTGRPRPIATTGTLLEKANAHLIATDARLKPVIEKHHCQLFSPEGLAEKIDPFHSLVSSIIGQQVSGAAARSIKDKFVALFNKSDPANGIDGLVNGDMKEQQHRFPTPEEIIKYDIETLRTAGLSQRKAEYILGLSEKFASGELSARMLLNATDEEIMEKLIAVRGLGKWSVEMFACFALKRTDVFSTGDLGVQRGCAAFMGRDVSKLKTKGGKFKYMSEQDMLDLAVSFSPYRSLFMWYMWRVENVDIAVMN